MKKLAWLIIILLSIFILIWLSTITRISANFDSYIYQKVILLLSPIDTKIAIFISDIGSALPITIFCVILLLIYKTRYRWGFPLSIAMITSSELNLIFKDIFGRERPNILRLVNETDYSFPSGHAMSNATLYILLILLILKYIKNKKIKIILIMLSILLTILIGISRIYLGVHYATDIIGGWILGASIALIIFNLWNYLNKE